MYLWLSRTGRPRFQGCRRGKDAFTFIVREKIGGISVNADLAISFSTDLRAGVAFFENIDFHRKSNRCRHCSQKDETFLESLLHRIFSRVSIVDSD
ncbi:hypothetical protein CEXT_178941 [Caerostris extrusa]|uniref:Uncharacterized protein n=1 Tax=Caerostris extrusa TaxID=172846 RepID=A0AAV4RV88_CAEEX|nr:hypothetical protein CEXT_178941 [Caerostris extrusa]